MRLAALLAAALNRRSARPKRRPPTQREVIVNALVDKAADGDIRAAQFLLELVWQNGLDREGSEKAEAMSARQRLIEEQDRLAAEEAAEEETLDATPTTRSAAKDAFRAATATLCKDGITPFSG